MAIQPQAVTAILGRLGLRESGVLAKQFKLLRAQPFIMKDSFFKGDIITVLQSAEPPEAKR